MPTKTTLARELITLIGRTRRDRAVQVVADGSYMCTTLRHLPANVTGPLLRAAALGKSTPTATTRPACAGGAAAYARGDPTRSPPCRGATARAADIDHTVTNPALGPR